MIGDTGEVTGAPGGGGAPTGTGAAGAGFLGGFSGGLLGGGLHGSGQMAARGLAQTQLKLQLQEIRRQQQRQNLALAHIYSHVPMGTPHATVQTNPVLPQVVKLGVQLAKVTTQIVQGIHARHAEKKKQHQIAAIQAKIAHQIAKGPVPTYQEIALTGLNSGPPIPGATYY